MKNKYSVVHGGPIKYTVKLIDALVYARNCVRRKGFRLGKTWTKLPKGDSLAVFNLVTGEVVQDIHVE